MVGVGQCVGLYEAEQLIWDAFLNNDWKAALNLHQSHHDVTKALLWPAPDPCHLINIGNLMTSLGFERIVSIGCGTGLLEWCLQLATGVPVVGVEVNAAYWSNSQTRKAYIPLVYPDDKNFTDVTTSPTSLLMFCYFNSQPVFLDYIQKYKGRAVIIIGPHDVPRFTEPSPVNPGFEGESWTCLSLQEIRNTSDYIGVYVR